MQTCIKVINIVSFIFLIISEVTSIVLCTMYLIEESKNNIIDVELNNVISIIIAVAGIIIIVTTGLYALYLRKVKTLFAYVVLAGILCAFKISFALMLRFSDSQPQNSNVLIIIKLVSAGLYVITAVCIYILRTYINEEMEKAPLTLINDSIITEDMYNNMLDQSKDPKNKKLKEEFNKMINNNNNNNINTSPTEGEKLYLSGNSSLRDDSYTENENNKR